MVKILSLSGNSLADIYDVVGSVAGIEQLDARELSIVHEMGGTLFSERVSGFIRQFDSLGMAQNTAWDITSSGIAPGPYRVLGVTVLTDSVARISNAMVALREPVVGRELPIFAWGVGSAAFTSIRMVLNGAPAANLDMLQAIPLMVPNLGIGSGQPATVPHLAFRGSTSGFGAGTVDVHLLFYIAFSTVTGLSSRGLPIPSW